VGGKLKIDLQRIENVSLLSGNATAKELLVTLRKSLPIADFAHLVVHNDNSWTGISSDDTWIREMYFGENSYQYCEIGCLFENLNEFHFSGDYDSAFNAWMVPEDLNRTQNVFFNNKGYKYFINFSKKNTKYYESFFFFIKTHNDYLMVMAQYDKIEHFVTYLRSMIHSSKTLQDLYSQKEVDKRYKNSDPNFTNIDPDILFTSNGEFEMGLNKIYLDTVNQHYYLTTQEIKCLRNMYLYHKSAKETAKILNISYRTVQKHVQNVRNRFKNNIYMVMKCIMQMDSFI